MSYPKISIVTPSYNQGKYLAKTMQSILGQGYPNLEYVVIDGNSPDDSAEIIKKHESHLKFWVSKPMPGIPPTLYHYYMVNEGFSHCTGEIMAWLNSDDIYHPYSLFTVAEIFTRYKEVKWLMGNPSFIDDMGRIVFCSAVPRWSRSKLLNGKFTMTVQQESTFWHRDLWEKTGAKVDTEWHHAADYALWVKFSKFEKLYTTHALLAAFRLRVKNQKTVEKWNDYKQDILQIIKKEKPSLHERFIGKFFKFGEMLLSMSFIKENKMLSGILCRIFDIPPILEFDRTTQTFNMR